MQHDYSTFGMTQRQMADLTGFTATTIARELTSRNIEPLTSSSVRNKKYDLEDCRVIMKDLYANRSPIEKCVHTFYNFKGGVGKTSLCYQVSTHLALLGYKVLLIDSDPQANLTSCFGYDHNMELMTLRDILVSGVSIETAKLSIYEGLDLIPSNISLTRLEGELDRMPRREEQVSLLLDKVKPYYDFIFIDSNPNISHINRNAITAADVLDIVCETQPFSVNGLSLVMDDLRTYFARLDKPMPVVNIVPNKYEDRVAISGEAMAVLRDYYGDFLKPDFAVRKSEDFNQSAKNSTPLAFFSKKNSIAWADIIEVVHYIVGLSAVKQEKQVA